MPSTLVSSHSRVHVTSAVRAGGWLGVGNESVYVKSRCFDHSPFPLTTSAQVDLIRRAGEALDAHRRERRTLHPEVGLTDAYNVLAKLRAGTMVASLDEEDRAILEAALVVVLRELHDDFDAAVTDAYGWPANLTDDDILARLVALNKARAADEVRGMIHWLRPSFQVPRLGIPAQGTGEQVEADLVVADGTAGKPGFPADDMAQTAVVIAALMGAAGPLDAPAIASGFQKARHLEERVGAVLAALSRLGFVTTTDGGRSCALRRAA
ncbi:hypothetical protein ASG40_10340 [Methylobacterium sp. Leaf399]|nr:hypothetical protein ASG40_10340 [Methylobacterium sp. Leaf399]